MGKVDQTRRASLIAIRRKRKKKVNALRARFAVAKSKEEKQAIIEKAFKINTHITEKEFISPIQNLKQDPISKIIF